MHDHCLPLPGSRTFTKPGSLWRAWSPRSPMCPWPSSSMQFDPYTSRRGNVMPDSVASMEKGRYCGATRSAYTLRRTREDARMPPASFR